MSITNVALRAIGVLGALALFAMLVSLVPGVGGGLDVLLTALNLMPFAFGAVIAIVLSYQNWRNRHVK